MSDLASKNCEPCERGTPSLRREEQQSLLRQLQDGWEVVDGHHLVRAFAFPDFATALAFTNRVGALAEHEGHHPEIQLGWGRVRVRIWTHVIDGLSENDFVLAAKIDRLLQP